MSDYKETPVFETCYEAEANMYVEMLAEAEILAQVRYVSDPLLNNIIRHIEPDRYRVVVLDKDFDRAILIVEAQYKSTLIEDNEQYDEPSDEPDENSTEKTTTLLTGRIILWTILTIAAIIIIMINFYPQLLMRQP
ncbi:MAG: hypothetical protein WCO98_11390 [bacterium]